MHRWLTAAILLCTMSVWCASRVAAAVPQESIVAQWEFDTDGNLQGWNAGGEIAEPTVAGGILRGRVSGVDPILIGPTFEIPAKPSQCVEIRMKAAGTSQAQLFWTETLEGRYGGFSDQKSSIFHSNPDGEFHTYRIFPFWHAAGRIVRLRLDPPSDGPLQIDWIRVVDSPAGEPTSTRAWQFQRDTQGWRAIQGVSTPTIRDGCLEVTVEGTTPILGSPLLATPASDVGIACIRMAVTAGKSGSIYYASSKHIGWESVSFPLRADGRVHTYNVGLSGLAQRQDHLVFVGITPTEVGKATARIASIELADRPGGPAELDATYFGPVEGINRVGRPAQVVCHLRNLGGQPAKDVTATLSVPDGVRIVGDARQSVEPISYDFSESAHWSIEAARPATAAVSVKVEIPGAEPISSTASIEFTLAPEVPGTGYVPQPRPVASKYDLGVFYFPGWATIDRWEPIQEYPARKPVLGWYNEANPECVDWQIKWAAEHGIKFFLVDWYWCKGNRQLEHWVNAYKNAKYRKYLKWAVMWANHNPPNTHSSEDWRKVTQYWIDNYFGMNEYYQIDGRPVVFIWAPANVRNDLGGSNKAAELYAMSQKMARDAGYKGIYFAAMSSNEGQSACRELKSEGYEAFTRYHGFEIAQQRANSQRFSFTEVVKTSPEVWQRADSHAAGMQYFPIVETGWSSEPWHGSKALSIYGRTPERFGQLCRVAREYADGHNTKTLIFGPWNEWGEGSYIEPCTEFGFGCLDQIRNTFCEPDDYPPNLVPADLGLGPYDLPPIQRKTAWQFQTDGDIEGWNSNGRIQVEVRGSALRGRSTGEDPILYSSELRVDAARIRHLTIRMKCSADDRAQVFWGTRLSQQSETNSLHFDVIGDGQFHDYKLDLGANPRWRGMVTSLRLDPVVGPGREFAIENMRLH